ncbi:MAG: hypothetical protein KDA29_12115 [Phycisphaerales bacterium]|nr:hypothetical protein [Phycisphaerales bacterium]
MSRMIPVVCVMGACGLARGEVVHWTELVGQDTPYDASSRALLTIDISGMASWDFQGDPDNEIAELFIGFAIPIGIEWDVYITTVGTSWAEEVTFGIADESLLISPAAGDAFTVSNMNYQGAIFGGFVGSFDGVMEIEFFETNFDDNIDQIDAYFEAGSTITIIYPAPGPLAVFGFGGLFAVRRRR